MTVGVEEALINGWHLVFAIVYKRLWERLLQGTVGGGEAFLDRWHLVDATVQGEA